MNLWASIFITAALGGIVLFCWHRLFAQNAARAHRWLLGFFCKGVGAPFGIWVVVNLGVLPGLPPLMPQIELAQSAGLPALPVFLRVVGTGLWTISTYWAAMTLGWFAWSILLEPARRQENVTAMLSWSLLSLPAGLLVLVFGGWFFLGLAALLWLVPPVLSLVPPVPETPPPATYSSAIAHMKFGRWNEAEWDVIRELEKNEDDFNGWLLLAELYALHFDDLPAAEQTIREACGQPNATVSQVAVALHRLADWHLKLAGDPVAARRALELISERAPGSHLDKMARQRVQQLPATAQELQERQRGRTFRLPVLSNELDTAERREPAPSGEDAAAEANRWVEKLKQNPDDVPAREAFAKVLAEKLGQPDLAIEQLELLLALRDQSAGKTAEWLGAIAAWHLRYRRDPAAARPILERLASEHAQTPQGFMAQSRLNLMNMEQRIRAKREPGAARRIRVEHASD